MVPREILNYAMSGRCTHLFDDFRMVMQMLERRRDSINVPRLYDYSFNTIAHHVACLLRGDLRQCACRGFISHFRAPLPLRRKNMDTALVQIIFRVADKSHDANVVAPELLQ